MKDEADNDRDPLLVARGKRLRLLRDMLQMTTKTFAEFCNSGESTIRQWEQGRIGGLSEKSALTVFRAVKDSHVECSLEWLLEGKGPAPGFKEPYSTANSTTLITRTPESSNVLLDQSIEFFEASIKAEINLFCKNIPQSVFLRVPDDAMAPFFRCGDYVGGQRCMEDNAKHLIGEVCIVQTWEGHIILRQLDACMFTGQYRLSALNPHTSIRPLILEGELISIAPVTRLWRLASF